MASAKNIKITKTSEKPKEKSELVTFINIRNGYLPGEQVLLTYTIDRSYKLKTTDSIALLKCGTKSTNQLINSYRWPVSVNSRGNSHRTRLGLPNPDRKLKTNDYQFAYVSSDTGEVLSRSKVFKISDIIELEEEGIHNVFDATLDVANFTVDREMFQEPITQPRPVKLYDVKVNSAGRSTVPAQVDAGVTLSNELKNALSSRVSAEGIVRVAELIKQFDRLYGLPNSIPRDSRPPENRVMATPWASAKQVQQANVAELLQRVEEVGEAEVIENRARLVGSRAPHLDSDELFLDRFIFPFLSGVLEYLSNDGYATIICKNKKNVLLESSGNKTLDLRTGWNTATRQTNNTARFQPIKSSDNEDRREFQPINQAHNRSVTAAYNDQCCQLETELEFLKHDSDVKLLQYIAELRQSQSKELQVLEAKINRLQSDILSMELAAEVKDEFEDREKALNSEGVGERMGGNETAARDVSTTLTSYVKDLEQRLSDKTEEYEMVCKLLDNRTSNIQHNDSLEMLRRTHYNRQNKLSGRGAEDKRKVATNTNKIRTREEATVTEQSCKSIVNHGTSPRPAVQKIQKATSYAASTAINKEKTEAANGRKQTATSEQGLTSSDQQSWLKLLQRILTPDKLAGSNKREVKQASEFDSTESMAGAMRRLFDMCSTPSLASTTTSRQSVDSSESVTEALRLIFGSDSSLFEPKPNSYPATPCNSADNVPKSAKQSSEVKHSSSMKDVLRWLFRVSDDDLRKALPDASAESITSLGMAMRRLFKEEAPQEARTPLLSTSNESLAQAMHSLFHRLSQQTLTNSEVTDSKSSTSSLGSVLLWGLADSTPEEYKDVDVKEYNLKKQRKCREQTGNEGKVNCDCQKKRNPSLSSVIRSSSPDRDVNISFPSTNKKQVPHKRSLIPVATRARPKSEAQQDSAAEQTEDNAPAAGFTFTTSSVLPFTVPDVFGTESANQTTAAPRTSAERRLAGRSRKRSRSRRMRAKKNCPHCYASIRSNTTAQSLFKMRQHIRSAHGRSRH